MTSASSYLNDDMKDYFHMPVLLAEVVEYLSLHDGAIIIDATLGGGGHAEAILNQIAPTGKLVGIDKDIAAIDAARNKLQCFSQQICLVHEDFRNLTKVLDDLHYFLVDGILLDLGVSSTQLDRADRGFSYQEDAVLDMRMDLNRSKTAADIIADYSKEELTAIFRDYGEERWASRIADFIVKGRERRPITTTFELVEVIKNAIPASARRSGGHPARRVFQALRIEVNDELESLRQVLCKAAERLRRDGRLVVISYHSLEDRIVKTSFQSLARGCICPPKAPVCVCGRTQDYQILTKKPILPKREEIERNPRSRSAKLRVLKRINE